MSLNIWLFSRFRTAQAACLECKAVVLWALVMQQAVRGVDYMTTGVNGDLRSLLRITMKPSKPGLGFMQARATPVEVSVQLCCEFVALSIDSVHSL